jgi:type I restriction enzyme R subunit
LLWRAGLSYSLRQGINDGFLAPYKVIRIDFDKDLQGWRPKAGQTERNGQLIEDRIYDQQDFHRTLILDERTRLMAWKITEYLEATDPYAKTIVFCEDIDHAECMRQALVNLNPQRVKENGRYVMRITGDDPFGKAELDNFIDPESRYPVIATTSQLMSTGVDAQTCKLIVLDKRIQSMTEFKQIIGRGTRINEDYDKFWFAIMDFKKATELFADPDFDGDPVQIYEPTPDDPIDPPVPPDSELPELPDNPPAEPPIIEDPIPGERRIKYVVGNEVAVFVVAELEGQGVLLEPLPKEVGRDYDAFDLVCHVAFGQPPLSRRERADAVKKRDVFAKYGQQARQVLEALLDKYADNGIEQIEDIKVLQLAPFSLLGTAPELVNAFGGKPGYLHSIHKLEQQLYA